ncbi:DUF4386 domain-containing protein [Candidatus Acetothermia bacterium]|nr:DUF4386 domain-containing protein [Candidatus Acetothermia bacterium]
MTISGIDQSQRKAARVAGFSYLFTFAIVVFANFGIHERLIVAGNAAETARNIMAHERLFRIGIASDLIYCAGVVVLLTALYVILKPVNRSLALLGAFWRLVYALMWVLMTLNFFDALRLLSGADYLRVFEAERLQALARLHLAANFDAYYVGLPFFGLASTVCSYLWFKSGYIPRALSAFGVISSAWCVICAFAFIIFPNFNETVNDWWFDTPMGIFEIAIGFWLLFKGLRPYRTAEPEKASA